MNNFIMFINLTELVRHEVELVTHESEDQRSYSRLLQSTCLCVPGQVN